MGYRRRQQDNFRDTAALTAVHFLLILCDRERPLCAVLAPRAAESRSQKHPPTHPCLCLARAVVANLMEDCRDIGFDPVLCISRTTNFPLPPPPARALRSHKIYCVLRVKYVVRIAAINHTPFFGIRLACAEGSSPTPHVRSI